MARHETNQAKVDKAIEHPLRADLLRLAAHSEKRSVSPREALAKLKAGSGPDGEPRLGTVVYHTGVLERAGLLKRGHFDPSRGRPFTLTPVGWMAALRVGAGGQ